MVADKRNVDQQAGKDAIIHAIARYFEPAEFKRSDFDWGQITLVHGGGKVSRELMWFARDLGEFSPDGHGLRVEEIKVDGYSGERLDRIKAIRVVNADLTCLVALGDSSAVKFAVAKARSGKIPVLSVDKKGAA